MVLRPKIQGFKRLNQDLRVLMLGLDKLTQDSGYAHLFDRSIISEARIENLEKKVFGIVQK